MTTKHLEDDYAKIRNRLRDDSVPADVSTWASEHLRDIQADLDLVLRGHEGYKDFLLAYIQREVERSRPDDYYPDGLEDSPYDEVREAPICTCSYRGCDLKDGRLPVVIRNATDVRRGIREFQRTHRGLPVVLVGWPKDDDVSGARDAWSAKRGLVGHYCRVLQAHLHPGATVPEDDPLSGELDAAPAPATLTPSGAEAD